MDIELEQRFVKLEQYVNDLLDHVAALELIIRRQTSKIDVLEIRVATLEQLSKDRSQNDTEHHQE